MSVVMDINRIAAVVQTVVSKDGKIYGAWWFTVNFGLRRVTHARQQRRATRARMGSPLAINRAWIDVS